MGTHSSPVDSANKYLRLSGGYRFYQFTALPCNMATVPLQFTKVAKEVKLMARAEGRTAMPRKHLLVGASCRKPGLDHKFLKVRFISNSSNQIFGYNSTSG